MADVVARIADGIGAFSPEEWDACAGTINPFVSHGFLSAMEESGSAVTRAGWQPVPIAIDGADGRAAAILPAYLKTHSRGEYVFDHGWADAWERAGGRYYPKLQIAVPFTPVPGPRLLVRDESLGPALIGAAETIVEQNRLSSAHATFVAAEQLPLFEAAGWLIRTDRQFHWTNRGYGSFDDFLGALSSRKRKTIRKEREAAQAGLTFVDLAGEAISPQAWDAFWDFYQDTGARKWGTPYLTRKAFPLLSERLGDKVVLMLALRGGVPIAGALNLVGADTLYGRYWGAVEEVPFLHFELCYYRAIDFAIAHGLTHVEAGAQGEHKLARGYEPTPTYSAHFIPDPNFRRAVADYLEAERAAVERNIAVLGDMGPYKKNE